MQWEKSIMGKILLAHFQVWPVPKTQQRAAVSQSLARLLKPLRHFAETQTLHDHYLNYLQAPGPIKTKAQGWASSNNKSSCYSTEAFLSCWPRIGARLWQAHNILHNTGSWAAFGILLCILSHIDFQGFKVQYAIGPQVPNFRRVSSMSLSMCEPTRLLLHCCTVTG